MDRPSRRRLVGIFASAVALTSAVTLAASLHAPLVGTFALLGGKPLVAAELTITKTQGSSVSVDVAQTQGQATQPITHYDIDMTKLMHMIVIRDDFAEFQHVHPAFNAKTGHFTQTLKLDTTHRFFVYVDSHPHDVGQQVFRFVLQPGVTATSTSGPLPSMTPSPTHTTVGPYTVTLAKTTLGANQMSMVDVTITKNGKLATDLKPYLGAAAHAVFIDTASMQYVHVHPMVNDAMMSMDMDDVGDMRGMGKAGPRMMMHVPPLPVGTYKLWLQFQAGTHLYVAPITIAAR